MRKIYQDIFENEIEDGNCLQACVASLLDLDLEEVPHFSSYGELWYQKFVDWGLKRGFYVLTIDSMPPPEVYAIMGGPSPRGGCSHAVISGPNNEIVHDPHPEGGGLAPGPRWCYLFIPVSPEVKETCDKEKELV